MYPGSDLSRPAGFRPGAPIPGTRSGAGRGNWIPDLDPNGSVYAGHSAGVSRGAGPGRGDSRAGLPGAAIRNVLPDFVRLRPRACGPGVRPTPTSPGFARPANEPLPQPGDAISLVFLEPKSSA